MAGTAASFRQPSEFLYRLAIELYRVGSGCCFHRSIECLQEFPLPDFTVGTLIPGTRDSVRKAPGCNHKEFDRLNKRREVLDLSEVTILVQKEVVLG